VFLHRALEELKDPAAIDALARLLNSSDAEVRRSAARGLRRINTKAIIELMAKALSDDDWEVRWMAVMGLAGVIGADAEGNSWYPSYDAFKKDEQQYLNYWRERVKKH